MQKRNTQGMPTPKKRAKNKLVKTQHKIAKSGEFVDLNKNSF